MAKLKVQIAALTALGIEAPEHATEMTHSRVKTTLKFLQCIYSPCRRAFLYVYMYMNYLRRSIFLLLVALLGTY